MICSIDAVTREVTGSGLQTPLVHRVSVRRRCTRHSSASSEM